VVWHRPVVPEADKERLARRQANAAVALLRLGRAEAVWPLLRHRPDPRLRTYLVARLGPLGADAGTLLRRLDAAEVSEKRALILCLGDFGPQTLPGAQREGLIPRLLQWYETDPDPGIHGATEWLLRQWGQEKEVQAVDARWQRRDAAVDRDGEAPAGGRRWYVNGQGQTMVLVPDPAEFVMGTPRTEEEREEGPAGKVEMPHRVRIGRGFAIAAKEVTVAQFLRFRADYDWNKTYAPTPAHPVNQVIWYEAAAYCNWLSQQAGIPPEQRCYLPDRDGTFGPGMRMRPGWRGLRGYRLPTEAEWEYACRAGAATGRYYGEASEVEVLGRYAWYTKNSQDRGMQVPGSLRPNDLGLFDLLGNALEWCQDPFRYYEPGRHGEPQRDIEYQEDIKTISRDNSRVLRGGAFSVRPLNVRSGGRPGIAPALRGVNVGFRPARTYP
jgi:formylglycine-generating enzyme required for sulfatase activity